MVQQLFMEPGITIIPGMNHIIILTRIHMDLICITILGLDGVWVSIIALATFPIMVMDMEGMVDTGDHQCTDHPIIHHTMEACMAEMVQPMYTITGISILTTPIISTIEEMM